MEINYTSAENTKKRLCPKTETLSARFHSVWVKYWFFPNFIPCNGRKPPLHTIFNKGLRGAFQKMRGLNHFQPVMVLSEKLHFFTSPLQHFFLFGLLYF
ncbi:glutamyl-tRNA synthetase [Bacillus sp. SG-1]|nr:glutamyl-tRNA synthetase [Bacillus sp. SG-1]